MGRRNHEQPPQQEFNMPEKSYKRRNRKSESDSTDHYEDSDDYYESIMERHSCTDILCSLLFLIFIGVLVAISVFAYTNGKNFV